MIDEIAEDEPLTPFRRWFALAVESESLAEAMTLATATPDGVPSVRAVLVKGVDERGRKFLSHREMFRLHDTATQDRGLVAVDDKRLVGSCEPFAAH